MIKLLATAAMLAAVHSSAFALNIETQCDGALAHGDYRATSDDGVVRITGKYHQGNRTGLFTIYDAAGSKMIELPYKQGQFAGTIRAWYPPVAAEDSVPVPKLVSEVRDGFLEGQYSTWYPDGTKRSTAQISGGEITSFEAWDESGNALDIKDQHKFLETDIKSDFNYYEQLEHVLDTYLPKCSE